VFQQVLAEMVRVLKQLFLDQQHQVMVLQVLVVHLDIFLAEAAVEHTVVALSEQAEQAVEEL
jgi:hypothetical protein